MIRPVVAAAAVVALCTGCATAGSSSAPATTAPTSSPTSATPATSLAPVPAPTGTLRAHESFLTVGVADALPGGVYRPEAPDGGTDDYRCFLADPKLRSGGFITGVQFLPGNPAVVHHSILFRVEPSQVTAARQKDAADPRPGWECFGGPGLPATSTNPLDGLDAAPWLAGWAPGGKENVFVPGFGVPVPAGTQIVIQMHYNLRATTGTQPLDNTHVRLRMSGDTSLVPLSTMLLPAPVELPCPAGVTGPLCDRDAAVADVVSRFGEGSRRTISGLQLLCGAFFAPRSGATQSCTRYVHKPVTIRAAAGHMHLLGQSIRIVANTGTPRERLVLDVPVWDFDNQSAVPLAQPVTLKPGDSVTVTCTHDATLRDKLPELKGVAPRYVVWGEGTTDEMCLGILITT